MGSLVLVIGPGLSCVPPSLNSPWGIPWPQPPLPPAQPHAQSCLHPVLPTLEAHSPTLIFSICRQGMSAGRHPVLLGDPWAGPRGTGGQWSSSLKLSQGSTLPQGKCHLSLVPTCLPVTTTTTSPAPGARVLRPAGQSVPRDGPGGAPCTGVSARCGGQYLVGEA